MKFFLGTNWKMHRTNTEARQFVAEFLPLMRELDLSRHYLFVIPSFTALQLVRSAVTEFGLPLKVGAQNVHWEDGVEATGEISARILADIPVDLVEVGHSERRQKFGETDVDVNRKARAVLEHDLTALICIGENHTEKEQGIGSQALETQVRAGLEGIPREELSKIFSGSILRQILSSSAGDLHCVEYGTDSASQEAGRRNRGFIGQFRFGAVKSR